MFALFLCCTQLACPLTGEEEGEEGDTTGISVVPGQSTSKRTQPVCATHYATTTAGCDCGMMNFSMALRIARGGQGGVSGNGKRRHGVERLLPSPSPHLPLLQRVHLCAFWVWLRVRALSATRLPRALMKPGNKSAADFVNGTIKLAQIVTYKTNHVT